MKFSKMTIILLSCLIAVSASATEIVFSGEIDGQFDLFRTDKDLTIVNRITKTSANELMPTVSPDGKKLAFISDVAGANSLYLKAFGPDSDAKIVDVSAEEWELMLIPLLVQMAQRLLSDMLQTRKTFFHIQK